MTQHSHVVSIRRDVAVCLTCGQVGKTSELIAHVYGTFLRRSAS